MPGIVLYCSCGSMGYSTLKTENGVSIPKQRDRHAICFGGTYDICVGRVTAKLSTKFWME